MRARWFIAAAGALGAARLLLRPRPDAGKIAVLDDSARVPTSSLPDFNLPGPWLTEGLDWSNPEHRKLIESSMGRPQFVPATFPHLSYAKPINIGVQRPGHTCIPGLIGSSYGCRACNDGRDDGIVVDVLWPDDRLEAAEVAAERHLEPAAIWNRICTEQGTDPETFPRRMAVFSLELMSLARAGQLTTEALDTPPPADPVGPMPINTSNPDNWFPRGGTARNQEPE